MPNVYRDCPQCGTYMKLSMAGNRTDAERKADWMLSQGHVCDSCEQEAREKANTQAASQNEAAGLTTLQGSEKQVAWAETIRKQLLDSLKQAEALLLKPEEEIKAEIKHLDSFGMEFVRKFAATHRIADVTKAAPLSKKFFTALRAQNRASWWIDNRNASPGYLAEQFKDVVLTVAEPNPQLEADATAEATVQPENVVTHTVATMVIKGGSEKTVILKFPEKNDEFREIVKKLGYHWVSCAWELSVSATLGSAEDRAAETMYQLLSNGFIVCCFDERVRGKALNANFERRYPRWVTKAVSDRWQGCIAIEWSDGADFDDDLKHFPSAKKDFYHNSRWYVRATEYASIFDFAETHGFKLTPNAEALLMAAKAAEEKHLLAQDLPKAPEKIQVKSKARDSSVSDDIADDLRDED